MGGNGVVVFLLIWRSLVEKYNFVLNNLVYNVICFFFFIKDKFVFLNKFMFSYKMSFWFMGRERWDDKGFGLLWVC